MIAELKRLEAEATEGPWASPGTDGGDRVVSYHDRSGKRRTLAHIYTGKENKAETDAALIVALRNSAKKMIAVCEAAQRHYNAYRYDGSDMECLEADDALFAALAALKVPK